LKGVWQFKEREVKLPAKILARKLERADVSTREAENALLAVSAFFTLVPRTMITGVHAWKTVRKFKQQRPQPTIEQTPEVRKEVQDAAEADALKEDALRRWIANRPQ